MIKKFIIALLICGVFWGIIRQQNHMPARLKLANKLNTTKIDNKEIKSTAMSGKKFIPNENKQPKDAVSVEVDHAIIQTNAVISHTSSINFTWNDRKFIPITADEYHSNNAQRKKLSSSDAVWNGRKFIITTTAENHSEIAQRKHFLHLTQLMIPKKIRMNRNNKTNLKIRVILQLNPIKSIVL